MKPWLVRKLGMYIRPTFSWNTRALWSSWVPDPNRLPQLARSVMRCLQGDQILRFLKLFLFPIGQKSGWVTFWTIWVVYLETFHENIWSHWLFGRILQHLLRQHFRACQRFVPSAAARSTKIATLVKNCNKKLASQTATSSKMNKKKLFLPLRRKKNRE
jgi:hypothetical protein